MSSNLLAVADGVGGWASQGVDPAIYSKQLCKNIDELVKQKESYLDDPKQLLCDAVAENRHIGSSTCVLAALNKHKPQIITCNLGDSGYILLRKNGLDLVKIFQSKEQQHQFNFPFQVGTGGDDPAKGEEHLHAVEHNDIIILASDGLWDNLFSVKIIDMVRPFLRDRDELLDP